MGRAEQSNNQSINCFNSFVLFVADIAKVPLLLDVTYRIGYYFAMVIIGSICFEMYKMPNSYFSNKTNILNLVFVKWAWGWTFTVLLLFIITTSYITTGGNKVKMKANVLRLFFGTVFWFVWTGIFRMIEDYTGECYVKSGDKYVLDSDIQYRELCRLHKGTFIGFDISGHIFLLSLCNLWLAEEAKILIIWCLLEHFLRTNRCIDENRQSVMSESEFFTAKRAIKEVNMIIAWLTIAMSLLSILWDVMIVVTVIYFHDIPTKIVAFAISYISWYISFKVIFPMNCAQMPRKPIADIEDLLVMPRIHN